MVKYYYLFRIISAKRCPALAPVSHGRILLEFDDLEVSYRARLECDRGYVAWGHSSLACLTSGLWSSEPGLSSCRPLSCGAPPPLANAGVLLRNGSTLWRDEAVYTCDPGYLLVVNDSTGNIRVLCQIRCNNTKSKSVLVVCLSVRPFV